jgi:hypothetical protein
MNATLKLTKLYAANIVLMISNLALYYEAFVSDLDWRMNILNSSHLRVSGDLTFFLSVH